MNNQIVPAMPSTSKDLVSAKGNVIGRRYAFGSYSASELKAVLRSQGHTGRKLTEKVNEALRSEAAQRNVILMASAQELQNRGYVPDCMDVKDKAAMIKWVKPAQPKTPKAKAPKEDARVAEMEDKISRASTVFEKLGLSKAEIAAIFA